MRYLREISVRINNLVKQFPVIILTGARQTGKTTVLIDQNHDISSQYIITGSQKFNLIKDVSDSPTRRCTWLKLKNFCINEILSEEDFSLSLLDINKFISRGFMPRLW